MRRIRFERIRRGVSQRALAAAANLHQPQVAQIERGILTPTSEQLHRLGAALDVAPDELLAEVVVLVSAVEARR